MKGKSTEMAISDLAAGDIPDLTPIIRHWVRKNGEVVESEVEDDIETIRESLTASSRSHYLVAKEESGRVMGVMGFGALNMRMASYKSHPESIAVGLLTAFLFPEARGRGLGKSLLCSLFHKARATGAAEMIWSSNPRFRETAWRFYTSLAGDPIGMINDLFYPGSVSPIWRKSLTPVPEAQDQR